ncbi:MAG: leucyl aminopeptidase [Bacteroidota bacterium]
MKLSHATQLPPAATDLIQVVLIGNHNLEAARALVRREFSDDIPVGEAQAEKGFQTLRITGTQNLMLLGVGDPTDLHEGLRRAVYTAVSFTNDHKYKRLTLACPKSDGQAAEYVTAISESAYLSNYQFLTYKTKKEVNSLEAVTIYSSDSADAARVDRAAKIAEATTVARDLVNEPVITLTAEELAARAQALGQRFGFGVEVFNKQKIRSLKMGGILAVNLGSIDPPTFSILEWKPEHPVNAQPVVLVGKGVVYDTGGLSLKPTANSMDFMKSDMAGAAAVIGTMCSVSALKLPVHVIGLVPATDNRPGQLAYTPGDVITMFDGSTVEVLNTDAEGRMLLADALAYAKKFDPELVIDLATLTGAAVVAVGTHGSVMMSNTPEATKSALKDAGQRVYERLVELPLWEEYREQLKSDIADLKNIGGRAAGSATAGKFLEHFTDYPWVHLDIAGPSFLHNTDSYRGKNGSGFGVRLLTEFIQRQYVTQ